MQTGSNRVGMVCPRPQKEEKEGKEELSERTPKKTPNILNFGCTFFLQPVGR